MAFRSKRPERVAEELTILARRHGRLSFLAVDNILDLEYLTGLLPRLPRLQPPGRGAAGRPTAARQAVAYALAQRNKPYRSNWSKKHKTTGLKSLSGLASSSASLDGARAG